MSRPRVELADLRTMDSEIRRRSYAFNRRPGARNNRGRIPEAPSAAVAPVTPLTILGSLAWWVRADLGITIGTGVSAWADQSGSGVNFLQGTGASQPALIAGAINGQPALRGDGADDLMGATWARAAPGTQPFFIWMILKQISWTSGRLLAGDFGGGTGFVIDQNTVSPQLRAYNTSGVNANGGAAIGAYSRLEAQFTNTVADYVRCGNAAATSGGNHGNLAGGGTVQLWNAGPSAVGGVISAEIAEAFAFLGTPALPQRASLDAYCTARYGAGLV